MIRQSISTALLIVYIACMLVLDEDDTEEKVEEAKRYYACSQEYCTIDEFEDMNYYLYCNTWLSKDASGDQNKPSIISNKTQSIAEAKELYQEFRAQLPLEPDQEDVEGEEGEETNVFYVSPDCKWVVTDKYSEYQTISTKMLFYEKEKVREKVSDLRENMQFIWIVKDEDVYKEMDELHYRKIAEFRKDSEYYAYLRWNLEGDLIAGIMDRRNRLTIRTIADGTEQWSFDLQKIWEEVRPIRKDMYDVWLEKGLVTLEELQQIHGGVPDEEWRPYSEIVQFEGDDQGGWLTVQAGDFFFRIEYPSGEVTYLGEYLYSLSFSPDGKYAAYTSVDYDNGVGKYPVEDEQTPPPGIYVKEIETGKTAYLYWDPFRNWEETYFLARSFLWLEKESFEEYMLCQ